MKGVDFKNHSLKLVWLILLRLQTPLYVDDKVPTSNCIAFPRTILWYMTFRYSIDLTIAAFCCILYRQFTLICSHVCAVNVNYLICNCTITVSRYIFHCKQVVEMPRCEIYKTGLGSSCVKAKALSRKYTVSPFSIDTFISNGFSGTLKDPSLQ
jgi:hypothetical protein